MAIGFVQERPGKAGQVDRMHHTLNPAVWAARYRTGWTIYTLADGVLAGELSRSEAVDRLEYLAGRGSK